MKGVNVNKAELVEKIAKSADLSKAAAERALDATTATIKGALKKGGTVTLVGFAHANKRAARNGRNPQPVLLLKLRRLVPKFRAGKA